MKYVLIAIWIGSSHGPRWNEVAMQEFNSIETCRKAEIIIKLGHTDSIKMGAKPIETQCIQK